MATTFSLAVIFIPVSFMSSVSGRFLYQFGITAAVAVLVSLLVSFTLTPLMSSGLLQREADKHQAQDHAASRNSKTLLLVLSKGSQKSLYVNYECFNSHPSG